MRDIQPTNCIKSLGRSSPDSRVSRGAPERLRINVVELRSNGVDQSPIFLMFEFTMRYAAPAFFRPIITHECNNAKLILAR